MSTKTATPEMKVGRSDLHKVPIDQIEIKEGFNVRLDYDEEKLKQLEDSIEVNGVLNPVMGYKKDGVYWVVDGHRRVMATKRLVERKRKDDPNFNIRVNFAIDNAGASELLIHMLMYNEGEPLTPLEQAFTIKRLANYGMEFPEMAEKLQKTQSYISRLFNLAQHGAPELHKAIRNGELESSTAMNLVDKFDSQEEQIQRLNELREEVEQETVQTPENTSKEATKKKKRKKITNRHVSKKQNLSKAVQDIKNNYQELVDVDKLQLLEKAIQYQEGKIDINALLMGMEPKDEPLD